MASKYSIVEPHPSVSPQRSILTGRGGSGNYVRAPSSVTSGQTATGPAARASVVSMSKPRVSYMSGRGGAGNLHNASERAIFSFDEELERQMARDRTMPPVVHVGRGGAANIQRTKEMNASVRRDSDSSASSNFSTESGADIATRKLKESWKKMMRSS